MSRSCLFLKRFMLILIYAFIFQCFGKKYQRKTALKTIKMIGKTSIQSFPLDWWPLTPTTTIVKSHEVTGTIPLKEMAIFGSKTCKIKYAATLNHEIRPTKFVDYTKSNEYKKLWKRTHRGLHWLPPKST